MELLYLHPNYFKLKTEKVREALGLEMEEEFYILRFISWDSFHDTNQRGFTKSQKLALIEFLSKQGRVFISSECQLSKSLEQYKLNIPPELLHDVLAEATLCISEGATTASEASVLGTATIYVNSLDVSYCKEQDEVYNINHCFKNGDGVIEKVSEILNQENLKETYKKRQKNLIKDKINPSSFLVWFIENYPESLETMKKHPEYQDRFKA
ncbi:MAG: hypothetical protein U5N26_06465 [Candidatus Marinimicrobia bacterium]|nr:hypothetical protein [Candidatus Neomarinimicrobiota bacterium]